MSQIDLLKKMSDARAELDAAFYTCQLIHNAHRERDMASCSCTGCVLRIPIERALNFIDQ